MKGSRPANVPLVRAGALLESARLVVVMLHGMGGDQARMVAVAERTAPDDVAILAPASAEGSWWPQRFKEPVPADDPHLARALATVEAAVQQALDVAIEPQEIVIAGFSQGACLALEHVARAGRPYRAAVAMTGALLGTVGRGGGVRHDGAPVRYHADLTGIRIAITTHAEDPQVPAPFVHASAAILKARGAWVKVDIAPGGAHEFTRTDRANLAEALAPDDPADG